MIRKGKEQYSAKYGAAMKLHDDGVPVKEIAGKLGISYSCAYHWTMGIRKPDAGNPTEFVEFIRKKGPVPVMEVKEKFPKHNEVFLICSRRSLGVKRAYLGRKFLEYSTWYYMEGQEEDLKKRIEEMFSKINEFRENLKEALKNSGL